MRRSHMQPVSSSCPVGSVSKHSDPTSLHCSTPPPRSRLPPTPVAPFSAPASSSLRGILSKPCQLGPSSAQSLLA